MQRKMNGTLFRLARTAIVLTGLGMGFPIECDAEGSPASEPSSAEDVCVKMIEAWYGGDAELMSAVVHDDLAKRGVLESPDATKGTVLLDVGKSDLVEGARKGIGTLPQEDWNIEARTLDETETMAVVKVTSARLIDLCQLAKLEGRWIIVNVLWTLRE